MSVVKSVDFLITTMDRYDLLDALIRSIYKYYPNANIVVADQSFDFDTEFWFRYKDVKLLILQPDCGLSYARNMLVSNSFKKYKLILEDDFLFTEKTRLDKMLTLVHQFDVVGGAVKKDGIRIPFEFNFLRKDDTLYQVPDGDDWQRYRGINYKKTSCVMNFAMYKREVFDAIKWDWDLKLREHQDFFYRLSIAGGKVVFTPDAEIIDNKSNSPKKSYEALKGRDEFWGVMMRKHGLKKVKYLNGSTVELENGIIHRSYEPPL